MRSIHSARWLTCALAISICGPALAGVKKKKSLSDCTSFSQADHGDDAVKMTVHNSCKLPVDCSITWRLVCAPDTKRRAVHRGESKFTLGEGAGHSAEASAAVCGDDGWTIDAVQWGCDPAK